MQDNGDRDHQNEFIEAVRAISALDAWNYWDIDPTAARNLLAQLFRALSRAPQLLRINRVEGYHESALHLRVQQIGRGLETPHGSFWPDFDNASPENTFDAAFLAMRMLDEDLALQPTVFMSATLHDFETEAGYFVVPCRKIAKGRDRLRGQGLYRRGLLHHRIAPMQHDGVRLCLHVHPDVRLRPDHLPPRRKVGAAVFPTVDLVTQQSKTHGPGSFLVTGLSCTPSQEEAVIEQCQRAVADLCDTLIWPELTMPPERVTQVRALLGQTPLKGERPPVVVAGSWHVPCGQQIRNRSEILDGRGERLFWFDKCLAYLERRDPYGDVEGIDHGSAVQLLLAEDELIVFQICLDFCHVEREALLKACDASLVIVPSMGNFVTLEAHRARAEVLQTSNNTRTVVVQQRYGTDDVSEIETIGYILRGVTKPRNIENKDIFTSELFSSFYTEGDERTEL